MVIVDGKTRDAYRYNIALTGNKLGFGRAFAGGSAQFIVRPFSVFISSILLMYDVNKNYLAFNLRAILKLKPLRSCSRFFMCYIGW